MLAADGSLDSAVRGGLISLAVIFPAAFVCGRIARRLRQPTVMGEIIAGLLLGPSLLGLLPGELSQALFPAEARPFLHMMAQLGLVFFMFGVGYHLEVSHLRGRGRQVCAISLGSVALPFGLGAGLAVLLFPWMDKSQLSTPGLLGPTLFLGAAMSITAFPVLARIIAERGLARQPIGSLALASAALQDLLAWGILAAVIVVVEATGTWPLVRMGILAAVFVLGMRYAVRPALRWLLAPARRWASSSLTHAVLISGLLLSAWATDVIGLHSVFGAFVFGAVVPRGHIDAHAPEVPERMDQFSLILLPVFFTVTGLSVQLHRLGAHGLLMLLAVLVVACAGKFAGAAGTARLTGATARESVALGVLLNARGLTELVLLNVGLGLGVIDTRLFTVMVVMAVLTTLMTGPLLGRALPGGMGQADEDVERGLKLSSEYSTKAAPSPTAQP
ncbi:cation/H(+) antiporter [Streptomyces sp. A7024]|uniref:Cation/H(+) antiporter n=1 Tax=Streptomyces coryli TaxID=1128680 RepID=A0A6G4U3N2_9ACTN|nr:cation:proton antiporter [Streptomyces coryli]NGN66774.1 cation/H(+) antiporter [Streptomyces coryli]